MFNTFSKLESNTDFCLVRCRYVCWPALKVRYAVVYIVYPVVISEKLSEMNP